MLPGRLLLAALMLLTASQLATLFKTPANAAALSAAVRHEQVLRVHTDSSPDPDAQPAGLERLLVWPKAVLPAEKYDKLLAFITTPLPTTELVDTVFDGLARIFDAQDGSITTDFVSPEAETDFEAYRTALGEDGFWRGEAFTAVRRAPHAVLVADLAAEQSTARPEPYLFLLDAVQVFDLQVKADASLEYLIYRQADYTREDGRVMQRLAVYDDGFYRVFEKLADAGEWPTLPTIENPHPLGRCPARLLVDQALTTETALPRRGPLTAQLGALNRYPIWEACIEFYRMYGVFPILWSVEEQCDYEGPAGETCKGGFVQYLIGYDHVAEQQVPRYQEKPCPSCKANKYMGPGTRISVPSPTKETGDTRNPVGWASPDVAVLKEARETQERRRAAILAAILGGGGEPSTDQAQNEKQVRAAFEQLQNVLMRMKGQLERARSWGLTTMGQLRYGLMCRQVVANLGEQFFLKTPEQLAREEAEARKAGRSVAELSRTRDLRFATEYRGNPAQLDKARILSDLEPWSETPLSDILTQLSSAVVGSPLLTLYPVQRVALKADFAYYLALFESQYGDVRTFASLQPYHVKLSLITTYLLQYVNRTAEN